ncbi:membrane protein [Kwoniella heveanensis CBS 569]|nr:membrane protein [Kwoniella heveanensis CBS 569]
MSSSSIAWLANVLLLQSDDDHNDNGTSPAPPGSGPTQKFDGPWFSTQMTLSLGIGLTSFFLFCFLRTRWEVVYMGRTKLKDFSPTAAHSPDAQSSSSTSRFFGWIKPTLRTSEFTVLQTVGLDAAVLLNFFRMAFLLFSLSAFMATMVLIPLNLFRHGSTDSSPDPPENTTSISALSYFAETASNSTTPEARPSMYDILLDPTTSSTIHLIFTYLFTGLCLSFFHNNFHRFVLSRQSFGLHLIHSISSRTVLVSSLPKHLRGDRALADYFESCGWMVESVSVCRAVEPVRNVLEKRTSALLKLEEAWVDWVGNPAGRAVEGYDPNVYSKPSVTASLTASPQRADAPLIPDLDDNDDNSNVNERSALTRNRSTSNGVTSRPQSQSEAEDGEAHCHGHIHTTRPRPTYRPRWFGTKVDAIEYWEKQFKEADEEVKELRKKGRFEATHAAFVTFEDVKDAQTACQVVHYPHHSEATTELAPEPRDVVWSKVSMSNREAQVRDFIVMGVTGVLFLFWFVPVSSLATLLSYEEIKKIMPWLARVIDASPRLAAIVQNSLPSLALIAFNGLLPFLLEWLSYMQGFKSKSATEYSLLKKYHLFLLISVLGIFLLTSTYIALVQDLVDSPTKIPQKLAQALQGANVRNFMVSYVMLQALGLMPLQLLNMGPLLTLGSARAFFTKTPRDFAEANAPPMLNYGWVYPQALLVFTITLVFSVMSPLILFFGATYFGVSYLVYKYKLLFIYFKPYESNGEAWRITFARTLWALVIFQLFMTGLFSLRQFFWASGAMVPLILYTLWWSWVMYRDFGPLSQYLALSSICEVKRGEQPGGVVGVGEEGNVSRSQTGLNHRRYAVNDETLYVAPSDKRTDYSQPPMNNFYYGVLNTGRRRYAHPALSGILPTPWLPAQAKFGDGARDARRQSVVLSLRRKVAKKLRREDGDAPSSGVDTPQDGEGMEGSTSSLPEGWSTGQSLHPSGSSSNVQGQGQKKDKGRGSTSSSYGATGDNLNPWRDPTPSPSEAAAHQSAGLRKKISFDPGSGVIALPEDNVWGDEEDDEHDEGDEPESPSTYFHSRNRARTLSSSRMLSNQRPSQNQNQSDGVGSSSGGPTQPQGGVAI